jgi:hypothetical protein
MELLLVLNHRLLPNILMSLVQLAVEQLMQEKIPEMKLVMIPEITSQVDSLSD